jgi:tyrosyl-DNA phosphodiesterase 1
MYLAGHRLFHTNQKLMISLRLLKVFCTRSTLHLLSLVLSRLVCVVSVRVPNGADIVLKHANIPLNAVRPGVLRTRWDFSRIRTTLIPSIAGKHEGWPAVVKSGHTALMRAVNRLNPEQRAVSLEYQVRLQQEMGSEVASFHI